MKLRSFGLVVFTLTLVFSSPASGSLMPLPGTIIAAYQGSGIIQQFRTSNGASLNGLQLITSDGILYEHVDNVAFIGGQLLVRGFSPAGYVVGFANPESGVVTPVPQLFSAGDVKIGTRGNQLIRSSFTTVRTFNMSDYSIAETVTLMPPSSGTYEFGQFQGIGWTGQHFITAFTSYRDEVQYWNPDGSYAARRVINNPNSTYTFSSVDSDVSTSGPTAGYLCTAANDAGNTGYQLRMYAPGGPAPVWVQTINDPTRLIMDIAIVPVPSVASGLIVVGGLGGLALATRRRV